MQGPDFGTAGSFITGKYPSYMISPVNNLTDPGVYDCSLVLMDDNPSPLQSTYTFKITIDPLPPGPYMVVGMNNATNKTLDKNKVKISTSLIAKIKSIS